MTFEEIVEKGAAALKINLSGEQMDTLEAYYNMLKSWNEKFNLTSIRGDEETAELHFLDSMAVLGACDFRGRSVVDIGSGAGFPGIPIAVAEPSATVTLVESTGKKARFLNRVCTDLGLNAAAVQARAEDMGRREEHRQRYDICVSRAVARMDVLCELCMPLVKKGGFFIAMKSRGEEEEIRRAAGSVRKLGGSEAEIYSYEIPVCGIVRIAAVIRKAEDTDQSYPRNYAQIKKYPL